MAALVAFAFLRNAGAQSPAPLTSLRAIEALTFDEADKALPVAFEATVTYFRNYEATLFVQDEDRAIYVMATGDLSLRPGDRVLVKGKTQPSFKTIVVSNDIAVLRHGVLPAPVSATHQVLIRGELDCRLVNVRGTVRSAAISLSSRHPVTQLELVTDGGDVGVTLDNSDAAKLKGLLDSDVEVTAVASGRFDSKMQQVGVFLHAGSMDAVKIVRKAPADAQSLSLTPIDKVLGAYDLLDRSSRVRIQGVLTYFQPSGMAVLQDGSRSIRVMTPQTDPMRIGDYAEATGIPTVDNNFPALRLGEVRTNGEAPAIQPLQATWDELASGHSAYNLVTIEGTLVTQVREHLQDVYVISSDNHVFAAALRHPYIYESNVTREPPPMVKIPNRSRVRVTGVAVLDDGNPFNDARAFGMLLRTDGDVAVLAGPPLWSIRNLTIVVGLLLVIVIVVGARSWALDNKVRRQTITMAARIEAEASLERRRSHILEDISGARPLQEIVAQITELISLKLGGVPCWCQVADGARLGAVPSAAQQQGAASQEILARSGAILGTLYAVLPAPEKPSMTESEAMTVGAGLIQLAIETRRLYSDLRRRSEFDQLTEVHNRFSLDRQFDALIAESSANENIFGLVYVDLDDFKQVNDVYGHHVGDLYLQEVAARMKHQLRLGDLLARLGGDEFAALAPTVRGRADVEEVALRLERCFDDPFTVGDVQLRGSASVGIALYPEDGKTKDSLLNAADSKMYKAKNKRREIVESMKSATQ